MTVEAIASDTSHDSADPVDEALARSESTFRSPRMFDARGHGRRRGRRALEAREVAVDLGA